MKRFPFEVSEKIEVFVRPKRNGILPPFSHCFRKIERVKQKSPQMVYILVWLTVGVYWIFWLLGMMSETNRLSCKNIYNKRKIVLVGLFWLVSITAIVSGAWIAFQNQSLMLVNILFFLACMMNLLWIIAIAYLHADLGRQIGRLQAREKMETQATFSRSLLYFFLFYSVIPYLQSHYNKLIEETSDKVISEEETG